MNKIITKRILPVYFQEIIDGKKKFELRLGDFDIQEGDTLVLEEWTTSDPNTREFTGRKIEREITHVSKFKIEDLHWDEEEIKNKGLQIISFK